MSSDSDTQVESPHQDDFKIRYGSLSKAEAGNRFKGYRLETRRVVDDLSSGLFRDGVEWILKATINGLEAMQPLAELSVQLHLELIGSIKGEGRLWKMIVAEIDNVNRMICDTVQEAEIGGICMIGGDDFDGGIPVLDTELRKDDCLSTLRLNGLSLRQTSNQMKVLTSRHETFEVVSFAAKPSAWDAELNLHATQALANELALLSESVGQFRQLFESEWKAEFAFAE